MPPVIADLQSQLGRVLRPQKPGRKRKANRYGVPRFGALGMRAVRIAAASLAVVPVWGCRRLPSGPPPVGPRVAGSLRPLPEDAVCGDYLPNEADNVEPSPSPDLAERVAAAREGRSHVELAYSPDGAAALLYPGSSEEGRVVLRVLTAEAEERIDVGMPAKTQLTALWGPAGRHILVLPANEQRDELTIVCLSFLNGSLTVAGTGVGPAGSGYWYIGPFSPDGHRVFCGPTGQIWTVSVPDCGFSLLYTPPPVPQPEGIMYGKMSLWGSPTPSPSGQFLLFTSCPPDNYRADALWLLDVRTRQCRLVTWEPKSLYHHFALCWGTTDSSFTFMRVTAEEGTQYYELTLDPGIWTRGPSLPPG